MDAAETRANAVAMLRRAASLPRLKDGRRPPMHGEAGGASEGERSRSEEKKELVDRVDVLEPLKMDVSSSGGLSPSEIIPNDTQPANTSTAKFSGDMGIGELEQREALENEPESSAHENDISEPDRPPSATPSQSSNPPSKRRSRSRSRSRGSKDMRAKLRQIELASQQQAQGLNVGLAGFQEAGPDDVLSLDTPALTSPQAYLMQLQMASAHAQAQATGAPSMFSPLSPFALSPAASLNPGMPTLQALQNRHLQGLFRSNSAAARMMAMHKLTGGSEPFDLTPSSVSDHGHGSGDLGGTSRAKLTRNNTIFGEERVAARQQLLRRLNERIQDRGDLDPLGPGMGGASASSAPEDMPTTTKGRRRRSRRKSQGGLVDDRDAANTPAALALRELYPPLIALPPSRAPSIPLEKQLTPASSIVPDAPLLTRTPTPLTQQRLMIQQQQQQLQQQIQQQQQQQLQQQHQRQYQLSQFDSPMKHRGPVVEEEDDDPVPTPPRQLRGVFPASRTSPSAGAAGNSLGEFARSRSGSTSRQDVYPKSPFERPREEPPDDEPEHVLYGNGVSTNGGRGGNELLDREISWVADPVPTMPMDIPGLKDADALKNRDPSWIEPSSLGSRMPIYDEDDDESDHDHESRNNEEDTEDGGGEHPDSSRPTSRHSPSNPSQELLIDLDASATNERTVSDHAPSRKSRNETVSTATVNTNVNARESQVSDISVSSTRMRGKRSSSLLEGEHEQEPNRTHSTADSLGWGDYSGLKEAVSSMGVDTIGSSGLVDILGASSSSVNASGNGASGSGAPPLASKRSADSTAGTSTWSKMKGAIARSGSSLGRRSRTNSIAKRTGDTESSRESAASLGSGKRESKGDLSGGAQLSPGLNAGPAMQGMEKAQTSPISGWPAATARSPSPGAFMHGPPTPIPAGMLSSASIHAHPPRTGASPMPPPTDTEAAKFLNPKLTPFPAFLKGRVGQSHFASSLPDVTSAHTTHAAMGDQNQSRERDGALGIGMMGSANSSTSSQQLHKVPSSSTKVGSLAERRLSHQASDSQLLQKFQLTTSPSITGISGAPSSAGVHIDYFAIPQHPHRQAHPHSASHSSGGGPSGSASLPFTREGVKKWLSARLFPSASQQGGTVGGIGIVSNSSGGVGAGLDDRARLNLEHKGQSDAAKKPSLSDLLGRREEISEWEEAQSQSQTQAFMQTQMSAHAHGQGQPHSSTRPQGQGHGPMQAMPMSERSRVQNNTNTSTSSTDASANTGTIVAQSSSREASRESVSGMSAAQDSSSPDDPLQAYAYANAYPQSPGAGHLPSSTNVYDNGNRHETRHTSVPLSSSHDPSSTTPDPASSEESPSQASQRSTSSLGSLYDPSRYHEQEQSNLVSPQATDILQRLDQVLHADSTNRLWSSALNSPPRRLLLCTPMLQVANCNTVKDRFLFLFSDLLVIAKPQLPENRDSLVDPQKVYPPDRKFFIKNAVHLKDLKLHVDRDEDMHARAPTAAVVSQRPEFIRRFVTDFSENADAAIAKIIDLRDTKGALTLGRLLVQLPEIDRAKLGEYLSRRTSKAVLRAYIDMFGFKGINIDTALRIFLLSIHMPSGPGHANTLETLLDTFAARWYEANASIVAFDRDLAMRLVRAIVRLNEALHSTATNEFNGSSQRTYVTSRDFTEAFRRHDQMGLVPDSTLERMYTSVRHEKLCQARNPTNGRPPLSVSLKRPVPPRITYRRQSEPIVVRIPQADPQFMIELFGQDLTFDPPILTFAKSSEASFRITGNSFGLKTLVLACMGPNAPNYSGMPLSTTVNVERAFMRNTFQLAFADLEGRKRKYMFSVDDPVIRHEWTGSLKRQIENARATCAMAVPEAVGSIDDSMGMGGRRNSQMQVYRAADLLAFNVLQETLLSHETVRHPSLSSMKGAAIGNGNSTVRAKKSPWLSKGGYMADHSRSRSRSKMYKLGAGKQEYLNARSSSASDVDSSQYDQDESLGPPPASDPSSSALTTNPSVRLWTGAELELVCQQNSAIALVLSLLQAALPYDTEDDNITAPGLGAGWGGGPASMPFQFPVGVMRNVSQSSAYQI